MKKIATASVLTGALLLAGCGQSDYSADNFSYFERIATQQGAGAIDELRFFVYQNPEHPGGNLLLGQLLLEHADGDNRSIYLARHYLQQAIKHGEDTSVAEKAQEEFIQARLMQGATPGDPTSLIDLAEFAKDNQQPLRSAELYVRALDAYLQIPDFNGARDAAELAYELYSDLMQEGQLDDEQRDYVNAGRNRSLHALLTIQILDQDLDDANELIAEVEALDLDIDAHAELPSPELLYATLDALSQISRPGFIARWTWRSSREEVDPEIILAELVDSNERNQRLHDDLRYRLSGRLMSLLTEALDPDKAEEIITYARLEAINYFETAGEYGEAEALRREESE